MRQRTYAAAANGSNAAMRAFELVADAISDADRGI